MLTSDEHLSLGGLRDRGALVKLQCIGRFPSNSLVPGCEAQECNMISETVHELLVDSLDLLRQVAGVAVMVVSFVVLSSGVFHSSTRCSEKETRMVHI